MARKKLLIKVSSTNCPPWVSHISGVGRSTLCLVNALDKIEEKPFDIEVYADGVASMIFNFHGWKMKHYRCPITVSIKDFVMPFQILWRRYFLKYDLLHIPHNHDVTYSGERFVITIHDLFEYERSKMNGNTKLAAKYESLATNSVAIMACSKYTKAQIVEKMHVPEDKVHVVYWGVSTKVFYRNTIEETSKILNKLNIDSPYFFSVTSEFPRKNIPTLLKAFRKYITLGGMHKLVIVWGNPSKDLLDEYNKEIEAQKLMFLPNISDEILRSLYNGASCTMYPSRAEGFGLPILESFACGTPVMTCRNTCLEEVGQDAAIYVGEDDVDGMVNVMNMFETGSYDLATFQERADRIVNEFTWENTARQYVDFYMQYL